LIEVIRIGLIALAERIDAVGSDPSSFGVVNLGRLQER
jgi:hypothetical protein